MILALLLVASPSPPIYLLCTFAKGPVALDVIADEGNGQITTLVQSTGHMERRPAIFSPTVVKWSSPGSLGLAYRLSRVDLSLIRVMRIGGKEFSDTATCIIQEAPKRVF